MGSLTRGPSYYKTKLMISIAPHFLYFLFSNSWDRTDPDQSWFCCTWGIPAWTSLSTFLWISSRWSLSSARSFSRVTGSWNRTDTHQTQTIWDHIRPYETISNHMRVRPHQTLRDHIRLRPYETISDHMRSHQTTWDHIRPYETTSDHWYIQTNKLNQHAVVRD